MQRLTVLATLIIIGLMPAESTPGDDKPVATKSVEGSWEGQVLVTPQISLRITLDLTKAKDGSLSGTWGSPDQGAKGLPLESLNFADGTLTFSAKTAKASYTGKMNASGTEIAGEWSQGGKAFVLDLKRIDPSKVVVVPIPGELEGIWEGKLQVNGGITLRLALTVEKGKDGAAKRLSPVPIKARTISPSVRSASKTTC